MAVDTNHGTANQDGIKIPYGKDSSEMSAGAAKERINNNFGGGKENLSHTLNGGGSSNQRQK